MKTPLLILGGGTFAIETLDIAEAAGIFEPIGFVVNLDRSVPGTRHAGLPVFWIDDLTFAPDACVAVTGIVSTKRRPFVEAMVGRGYRFTTVVHPAAVVSPRATVHEGCVVHAGVIVSANTVVGPHVVLNRGCLIGHDSRIESFSTIGPGANLAGGTDVGVGAYVGGGAIVRDHLSVGSGAVVGAGAVVVKPVPPHTLVTGVPARSIRANVNGL